MICRGHYWFSAWAILGRCEIDFHYAMQQKTATELEQGLYRINQLTHYGWDFQFWRVLGGVRVTRHRAMHRLERALYVDN